METTGEMAADRTIGLAGRVFRLTLLLAAALSSSCDRHPSGQQPASPGASSPAPAASPAPSPAPGAPEPGAGWFHASPQQGPGLHLAYTHDIELGLPAAMVPAHFAAARDRCLAPATRCILLATSLSGAHARLQLRLPHDQVAPFANALTEALPGEPAGRVRVLVRSTQAADLGRPIIDVTQRVTQLTEYLASLKSMAQRLTISVSDLVKIASETAQAQSQIEQAQAEQRDLALRVDTEELDIGLEGTDPAPPPQDPIARTLANAGDTLRRNAADALQVTIEALPWVPLALIVLLVLAVAGRRRR